MFISGSRRLSVGLAGSGPHQKLISGVNKLSRTATGNRLEHNALVQESWAHLQEAQADAQEDHERQMLVEKETFWSIQKTYIL